MALDLHNLLVEHVRNRSGSGRGRVVNNDSGGEGSGRHTSPLRPGILLRNHDRTSSSSQSQTKEHYFARFVLSFRQALLHYLPRHRTG